MLWQWVDICKLVYTFVTNATFALSCRVHSLTDSVFYCWWRPPAAGFHGVDLSMLYLMFQSVSALETSEDFGPCWGGDFLPFVCPCRRNTIRVKLSKQLPEYWFNKHRWGFKWAARVAELKGLSISLLIQQHHLHCFCCKNTLGKKMWRNLIVFQFLLTDFLRFFVPALSVPYFWLLVIFRVDVKASLWILQQLQFPTWD